MRECDEIKDLLGLYLYDSATPTERAAVEEHIAGCERCADDLRSRQKVLKKLRSDSQPAEMPKRAQDTFAINVYKRIALESLRQRTRTPLRSLILQPSLAAVALVIGIAIGFFRFSPVPVMVSESEPAVVKADETSKKEARAALYAKEFLERNGTAYEREPGYTAIDRVSTTEQPSTDLHHFIQDILLTDSQRQLEDANLIYSLGDHRRALAGYQRLVDRYPDTDAAVEAQGKIASILDNGI
jgi:hypothetical protein